MIDLRVAARVALFAAACAGLAVVNTDVWASEPEPPRRVFKWKDSDGESYYHISGSLTYSSGCRDRPLRSEEVQFSQVLAADTTAYEPPSPKNKELAWVNRWDYRVEAFDSDGNVIAQDGSSVVGDCFLREPMSLKTWIMEGPVNERVTLGLMAIALLAFGAVSLFAGLVTLRKRA